MLGHSPLASSPLSTLPAAAAGASYTLTADPGAFVEAGTAAGVLVGRKVGAGAGTFVEAGADAGLRAARLVGAGGGSFVETGGAAGVEVGRVVGAGSGTVALDGTAAGVRVGRRIAAGSGAVGLAGSAAAILYDGGPTDSPEAILARYLRRRLDRARLRRVQFWRRRPR